MVGAFKLHMIGMSKKTLLFFFAFFLLLSRERERERERNNTLQFFLVVRMA
jgi:hypothetical protein